jgi:hypothetical protein
MEHIFGNGGNGREWWFLFPQQTCIGGPKYDHILSGVTVLLWFFVLVPWTLTANKNAPGGPSLWNRRGHYLCCHLARLIDRIILRKVLITAATIAAFF